MNPLKSLVHTLLAAGAGACLVLLMGADGGQLTGEVHGLDEEGKIVHEIENAQTYDFRLHVAFYYAVAELGNDSFYTNAVTGPEHVTGMNAAIVMELRRAMLCEDAPKWVKEQLPYTRWWSTNTVQGVPWRWQSQHQTVSPYALLHGPGVDFSRVDDMDMP